MAASVSPFWMVIVLPPAGPEGAVELEADACQ